MKGQETGTHSKKKTIKLVQKTEKLEATDCEQMWDYVNTC